MCLRPAKSDVSFYFKSFCVRVLSLAVERALINSKESR